MTRATTLAALLAVVGFAGTARGDGDRTLHLAVHGSLDADAVARALGAELGVAVEVSAGACAVPCLDVAVDGRRTATILFSPRTGAARSRSVALGSDTTQWPLVVTLLAGNVVRDEAQDLLAGLPDDLAAPAIAPVDAPPAPPALDEPVARPAHVIAVPVVAPASEAAAERDEPRERSLISIGFVPGLSTDLTHVGSVQHFLSFNALVGVAGGSSGLAASGLVDVQRGVVGGFQLAGLASAARRVAGTQAGGLAALSGDVDGVQLAGIAAAADHVDGVQAAGIAAVARRAAGTQLAGIAAVAGGDADVQGGGIAVAAAGDAGVQLAGIAAVAGRRAHVQAAGITNVARGTAHIQIAGVANVAGEVEGLQLAPVNISRGGDGVQVGVVNVGGSPDGFAFGLVNIVPGGRYDLESAIDTSKTGTLLFRHGGRRWHNVYGVGGHPTDRRDASRDGNDDVWMYGLGFGPSLAIGDTTVDLEAIAWQVNHGPSHESDISLLAQARLSVAHSWGAFGLVAGLIYNTYITDDHMSPLLLERSRTSAPPATSKGVTVERWPSAFVGVRI